MDTFVVRFKNGAEQEHKAESVMGAGEGERRTVHLFPHGITELASNVESIHRVVHDRTGKEKLQPWWPEKGDVPLD